MITLKTKRGEGMRILKTKRGEGMITLKTKRGEELLTENVIFIILNIIFFVMLMAFIFIGGTGAYFSEQYYGKQVALLIDGAKPGTSIIFDISDGYEAAKKNNVAMNNMFSMENNSLFVRFGNNRFYQFPIYNNVSANFSYSLEDDKMFLVIGVKDA